MTNHTFNSKGRSLAYGRAGEGPRRLVLVHGLCGSRDVFAPQVAHFAGRFEVLGLDAFGHGRSSPIAGEAYARETAIALRELLHDLPPKPTTLIGHSFGGLIVNELTDLGGDVVFVDSPCLADPARLRAYLDYADRIVAAPDWDTFVSAWFGDFVTPGATCRVKTLVVDEALKFERDWLASVMRGLTAPRRFAPRGRVLVANGTQYFPRESPLSWTALYPEAETWMHEGPGHFFFLEDPAPFNAALDAFLG